MAEVELERAATVELTLVYRTWNARWVPAYDIRLATGAERVKVGVNALVWQQTEEDWTDVPLRLSTAIPSHSADLPQLMAWFIEETPPPPPPPVSAPYEADRRRGRAPPKRAQRGDAAPAAESMAAPAYYDYEYAEDEDAGGAGYDYGYGLGRAGAGEGGGGAGLGSFGGLAPLDYRTVAGLDDSRDLISTLTSRLSSETSGRSYLNDQSGWLMDTNGRQERLAGGGLAFAPIANAEAGVRGEVTSTAYETSPVTWDGYIPASSAMGFDFGFDTPEPVTLPSDGQVHKVPLRVDEYTARIEHVVVPVVEQAAYVQAVVDNGSPYPVLAGMNNVFLDGGYLGQVASATVAPGQPLQLALGIDRSVKVKRRQEQLSDKGGLFGNQKVRAYQVTVELNNYHDVPVQARILDRIPYTYDEGIKVVDVEHSLEPSVDHGNGMLEWSVEVPPGQELELTFTYTLKHNKNYRVWHP